MFYHWLHKSDKKIRPVKIVPKAPITKTSQQQKICLF